MRRLLLVVAALLSLGAAGDTRVTIGPEAGVTSTRRGLKCPLYRNLACEGRTASLTRASTAWFINDSGVLTSAASAAGRFSLTRGILLEELRINRLLRSRDGSNAAWTKTSTTATLNATGKDGVASSATTVTATAGNGTFTQALAGLSSAARVGSLYVRRTVGSGTIELTCDGATWAAIVPPAAWDTDPSNGESDRFTCSKAASTTFTLGLRFGTNGDAVEVDLGQVEEGAFVTSPIPTGAAAVQRNADVLTVSSVGVPVNPSYVAVTVRPRWAGGSNSGYILDARSGATGWLWYFSGGGTGSSWFVNGGATDRAAIFSPALAALTTAYRLELRRQGTVISYFQNGTRLSTRSDSTIVTGPLGASVSIGSTGGSIHINAWVAEVEVHP